MTKKNRISESKRGITTFTIVAALLLMTGVAAAADISVPFIPQVPPGDWSSTKNCGQTSSLMTYSFYDGTTPTAQGIKDIDTWLNGRFGDPINNWNGAYQTTTKLETLAKEYGGKYGTFPYSYKASGWSVARVKQEIDAGRPVIVAVTGAPLGQSYGGHFLVAKGYTSTGIITNDPGRTSGVLTYTNTQFANAMSSQGGAVVVVRQNPITVTYPNSENDGHYWRISTSNTVQWKFSSAVGYPGSTVKIQLLKGTGTPTVIPITTINVPIGSNGQGSYTLPANALLWKVGTGYDYKVRVTTNYGYSDTSKYYFTIFS